MRDQKEWACPLAREGNDKADGHSLTSYQVEINLFVADVSISDRERSASDTDSTLMTLKGM
jgi:hypothetical protein